MSFQEQESPDKNKRLSQHENTKVLPHIPSNILNINNTGCFQSETQWMLLSSAHRLVVSMMLAIDGPHTDVESKALGESPITPLSQPKEYQL